MHLGLFQAALCFTNFYLPCNPNYIFRSSVKPGSTSGMEREGRKGASPLNTDWVCVRNTVGFSKGEVWNPETWIGHGHFGSQISISKRLQYGRQKRNFISKWEGTICFRNQGRLATMPVQMAFSGNYQLGCFLPLITCIKCSYQMGSTQLKLRGGGLSVSSSLQTVSICFMQFNLP